MREEGKRIPDVVVVALAAFAVFCTASIPLQAHAVFREGDIICGLSRCGQPKKPPCPTVSCPDTTNGIKTAGVCVSSIPPVCKAVGTQGIGGDMQGILGALKLIKDLFGGQQGGGGGGGGAPPPGATNQYPNCVFNPATNTYSPIPCVGVNGMVNYGGTGTELTGITGTSGTLGGSVADTLLNALSGTSGGTEETGTETTNVSDILTNVSGDAEGETGETNTQTGTQAQTSPVETTDGVVALGPGGTQGDIQVGVSGGTIIARSRDPQTNTEVAGFFGGGAVTLTQSQSLIGRLCTSRPWANGFISQIIPPSFFDGLCQRGGYQAGAVTVVPVTTTQKRPAIIITQPKTGTTTQAVPAPTVQPVVDIWAEPANVRLGTRTYIFWNTRGVVSCTETGPSFSQNSLSGGASTVPLSDASKFTIECTTVDGRTITDSVTVNLAI